MVSAFNSVSKKSVNTDHFASKNKDKAKAANAKNNGDYTAVPK